MKYYLLLLLTLLLPISLSAQASDMIGTWEGELKVRGQKITIFFNIAPQQDGRLTATLDVPSQMQYDLKMDEVTVDSNEITINFKQGNLQYKGKLSPYLSTLKGVWTQGGGSFALPLYRRKTTPYARPQTPQAPFDYDIEEVQYLNKTANIKLAGTLTIPKGKDKYPVAILISGSGAQDRNSALLKHKPFWVIADYLTSQGIAVLRFDDRGVGQSEGDFAKATTADFATDVTAAVQYLQKHPRIDKCQIGLIGHSEGGAIAQIVAAQQKKKIDFVVLLATQGVSGKAILLQQLEDILQQEGVDKELIQTRVRMNEQLFEAILKDDKQALQAGDLLPIIKEDLNKMSEADKKLLGLEPASLMQSFPSFVSPWMRYYLEYDPAANLSKIKSPILAINGDKDLQVAGEINLKAIKQQVSKSTPLTIKLLPNHNHLLQHSESGAISDYIEIEETISPEVLELMATWIHQL